MKPRTKVLLTIECPQMKNAKRQRSRFDQTLIANSWMLQENLKPVIHNDGTVSTISIWGRVFGERKTRDDIIRITQNLLRRAARDAKIDDYKNEFSFESITGNEEPFLTASVITQDD